MEILENVLEILIKCSCKVAKYFKKTLTERFMRNHGENQLLPATAAGYGIEESIGGGYWSVRDSTNMFLLF